MVKNETGEKKLEDTLCDLVRSDSRVIQIVSYETHRIHAMLVSVARALKRSLYFWNCIEGIRVWDNNKTDLILKDSEALSSEDIFTFYNKQKDCILLLEDFYPDLTDAFPQNIKRVRNAALDKKENRRTLVISQPHNYLHFALEKETHVFELPFPDTDTIASVYSAICKKYDIRNPDNPDSELLEAAKGLTIMEAEKAFSLAYIESGELTKNQVPLVIKEKENIIKKSGYLEYYQPKEGIEDVGGLDNLKNWLIKRGRGFQKDAKEYGLTPPRGILLLGIPGTGKSLTAKAIGNLWHHPLLKLDMGKIFGGIVGQSEGNIREALKIAERIAPCVLWVDEIEKAMSGLNSSGSTDGGTTSRVLGTFLTWLQEKENPVFVVATANDISKLPTELLRKGRMDEIFFTDLPTQSEREKIFSIHLKHKGRNPINFDIEKIATASAGFSGAEIEEVVKEAMFSAFDKERQLKDEDILEAIGRTFALSRTMYERIAELRQFAKSRAVSASSEEPEILDPEKGKDIPKLKQEGYSNSLIKKE